MEIMHTERAVEHSTVETCLFISNAMQLQYFSEINWKKMFRTFYLLCFFSFIVCYFTCVVCFKQAKDIIDFLL